MPAPRMTPDFRAIPRRARAVAAVMVRPVDPAFVVSTTPLQTALVFAAAALIVAFLYWADGRL